MMAMRRPGGRPGGPAAGGFMGLSAPVERSKDFRGTLRKLVARLQPERMTLVLVAILGSFGVAFSVIGPKIVGNAINVIFDGVIGKALPAGLSKSQAVALLRARGQNQIADLVS